MQTLDCSEDDVDIPRIHGLEIPHFLNGDTLVSHLERRGKEVLGRAQVQEIVAGLFDDVGAVDEKDEVAVAPLIKIQNGSRHNQCLAAARRHMEKKLGGFGAFLILGDIEDKTEKGFLLIVS